MSDKNLILFTSEYPFGSTYAFIEADLEYLLQRFNKIYIIPWDRGNGFRKTPNNIEVVTEFLDKYDRNMVLKLYKWDIIKILSQELFVGNLFNPEVNHQISLLFRILDRSHRIKKWIEKEGLRDSLFYTYWLNDWGTVLSILKSQHSIDKYYSRAHGYDLYEDRSKYGFIPFRRLQLHCVDKVFLVSDDGYNYLVKKYPQYAQKFIVSKLGTKDFGINKIKSGNSVVLLSIGAINHTKRIDLIVEILKKVHIDICWIHYGDGPLMEEVVSKAKNLASNITCQFMGDVSHLDIMNYLQKKPIDLLVNVSASEGIPVSIMEAISFGIPVFATDVGGIREIVNDKTGKLFEKDFDKEFFAENINNFKKSIYASDEFRKGVRNFWKKNFYAQKNYMQFVNQLDNSIRERQNDNNS